MTNRRIQLVALDLDGTLLDDDLRLSPRVQAAIEAALAQGVGVTLATGRALGAARPFAARLGITLPLICYQGAVVGDPVSGETLRADTLPPALAREAVERAEAEDLDLSLYLGETIHFRTLRWPREFYDRWFGLPLFHTPDLRTVLDQTTPMKFIITAEPPEADSIEARWRPRFNGRLNIVRSHALFVEGNPPGVSKGTALAWLAARLGVPQAATLAVGDNGNDLEMVQWAGVGVAMGNGAASVKAHADWIAPSVDEDGVAAVFERFVLS